MNYHFEFIKALIKKNGPDLEDYSELNSWIEETFDHIKNNNITKEQLNDLIKLFGDAFTVETMQGFAFQKPHGYAGDFEIIDRIYQKYISSKQHLAKWDIFWQNQPAAHAVRNRCDYFAFQVIQTTQSKLQPSYNVLNLASGPGRDMLNFFKEHSDLSAKVKFDCVEQDENAIKFASEICSAYLDNITFIKKNALRYVCSKEYDLIWSAGLFDYLDDKVFISLLSRLKNMLGKNGQVVIGNFCSTNPSKAYMNLFQWHLHHRSPNTLRALAMSAGFSDNNISIKSEYSGVNLFLHAKI